MEEASKLKLTCSHCGKPSHEAVQCWQLHPQLRPNKNAKTDANPILKKTKIFQKNQAKDKKLLKTDDGDSDEDDGSEWEEDGDNQKSKKEYQMSGREYAEEIVPATEAESGEIDKMAGDKQIRRNQYNGL
jgi:hypothetical protein